MTRRGTLAYYLAAWVIGCFVVAFLQWAGEALAGEIHTAAFLLTTYFFALAFGAVAILVFAFLLRRLMRLLGTHTPWLWLLAGAMLSVLEVLALVHAQTALSSRGSSSFGDIVLSSVLEAANALSGRNFWQVPIDGAITSLVLCLVDRAFVRPNEAAEPTHSPA